MEIWWIIILLFIASFVLALFALRKEFSEMKEVDNVKEELKKERVLFYAEDDKKH